MGAWLGYAVAISALLASASAIFDMYLTHSCLAYYGCSEANPALAFLEQSPGLAVVIGLLHAAYPPATYIAYVILARRVPAAVAEWLGVFVSGVYAGLATARAYAAAVGYVAALGA